MTAIKKLDIKKGYGEPMIDIDLKSKANDPFFVEKVAKAKEAVSKLRLPEYLTK